MRWTSETKPKGGRKPGSRNKLCRAVLEDLMADWAEGGAAAIKMMRIEQPAAYVRVMCSILPKELILENSTITELIYVPNEIDDGPYLLNLQIAPFTSDASPSRPLLFSGKR